MNAVVDVEMYRLHIFVFMYVYLGWGKSDKSEQAGEVSY